jgi:BlaI family transcriptional regulator, penicillinase repressor
MSKSAPLDLGRRERQIMEVVYAKGQASVLEVLDALDNPPSYSAVRAMLNLLEEKGHLKRKKTGKKFLYLPTVSRTQASRSVLKNMLTTFFNGSAVQAMASLIELNEEKLSDEDLDRLSKLIDEAKTGER